uniref:Uncharacterized protein n=1 Tax=Rhodosorus marinus TaxID=101924 RepID=A0A7S3EB43_9RHOD
MTTFEFPVFDGANVRSSSSFESTDRYNSLSCASPIDVEVSCPCTLPCVAKVAFWWTPEALGAVAETVGSSTACASTTGSDSSRPALTTSGERSSDTSRAAP